MVHHRSDSVRLVEGIPLNLLAVDPGERFVGMAWFYKGEYVHCDTMSPDDAVDKAWNQIEMEALDVVVAEAWRNYEGGNVTWSECRTAEIIGALRHKCRLHDVEFITQPATIKRPADGRMEYHQLTFPDLRSIPASERVHAMDAIRHGCWYLFEHGLTPGQTTC